MCPLRRDSPLTCFTCKKTLYEAQFCYYEKVYHVIHALRKCNVPKTLTQDILFDYFGGNPNFGPVFLCHAHMVEWCTPYILAESFTPSPCFLCGSECEERRVLACVEDLNNAYGLAGLLVPPPIKATLRNRNVSVNPVPLTMCNVHLNRTVHVASMPSTSSARVPLMRPVTVEPVVRISEATSNSAHNNGNRRANGYTGQVVTCFYCRHTVPFPNQHGDVFANPRELHTGIVASEGVSETRAAALVRKFNPPSGPFYLCHQHLEDIFGQYCNDSDLSDESEITDEDDEDEEELELEDEIDDEPNLKPGEGSTRV